MGAPIRPPHNLTCPLRAAPSRKSGIFLASYIEARPNQNLARLESPNSTTATFSSPTYPLSETINHNYGLFSLSGGSSLPYSLSQSYAIDDQDNSAGIQRQETGGNVSFSLSADGSYNPDAATYSLGSSNLSASGSATLTLTDDRRVVNDSYDLTRSGQYTYTNSKTFSPTIHTAGNNINGIDNTTETGTQNYSLHQTNTNGSDNYTLTETGAKPYTITGTDNANTGESDHAETGTDSYTITQGGSAGGTAYSTSLTGTDTYEAESSLNSQSGVFTTSTNGVGSYTKTDLLTSSTSTGSNSFASSEVGSTRDADQQLTTTGTDRYALLPGPFNDPSDGGNGTAGIGDFSPVGLPVMVGRASVPAGLFSSIGDARYKYCFAAGTLVLMADGSSKPIETIEVGEMVLAAPDSDPEAQPAACRVLETYHNSPARILPIFVNGSRVRTTCGHPFYVREKGWISADRILVGDCLWDYVAGWTSVTGIAAIEHPEPVFNLHVVASAYAYFSRMALWRRL